MRVVCPAVLLSCHPAFHALLNRATRSLSFVDLCECCAMVADTHTHKSGFVVELPCRAQQASVLTTTYQSVAHLSVTTAPFEKRASYIYLLSGFRGGVGARRERNSSKYELVVR
jgi:hypothetical protein